MVQESQHGADVSDPFRWLEDEKAKPVQEWMSAQDAGARARLAVLPARELLEKRFHELFYSEAISVPVKRGGRLFYLRTFKDREKAILYVREGAEGAERVLLDPNQWSADGTVSLGTWSPSWDGKKLAFAKKPNAADEAILYVLDLDSGAISETDVIAGAKYAHPSWNASSNGFFYAWLPTDAAIPASERPGYTEIRFHKLGSDPAKDPVIRGRTGDPSTFLNAHLSRDGRFLFVEVARGWNENDVYMRDEREGGDFVPLALGKDALYSVQAWKDQLFIVTNEGAPNYRVFKVSAGHPERQDWKEIVPEDPKAALEGMSIVGGQLALTYLRDASTELRLATLDGAPVRTVALPGIGTSGGIAGLEDEDDGYFDFSSFATTREIHRISIGTGATSRWAKVELPVKADAFEVQQVFYPSKDGTRISMFLVTRKGLLKDGARPTLLYGYGGFNISQTPIFKAGIIPFVEAGGIYAVANLRGGGEYGTKWHDAGRGHFKQNVFDDFAAAAEWLAKSGYTRAEKIAIYGGSNGGLLVGAAMTQHPELYGAVVCAVPLLDMVRYHLFGSGRTWIPEYGTAEKEDDFKVLHAYSPYHRIKAGVRYPPLLMLSADHDDRVDPMHARKFVALLQEHGADAWLRIEANAGHGGADQTKKSIEQAADLYAFLFEKLALDPKGIGSAR